MQAASQSKKSNQHDAPPCFAMARRARRRRRRLLNRGAGLRLAQAQTESRVLQRHGRGPLWSRQDDDVQHALRRLAGECSVARQEEDPEGDAARRRVEEDRALRQKNEHHTPSKGSRHAGVWQ